MVLRRLKVLVNTFISLKVPVLCSRLHLRRLCRQGHLLQLLALTTLVHHTAATLARTLQHRNTLAHRSNSKRLHTLSIPATVTVDR